MLLLTISTIIMIIVSKIAVWPAEEAKLVEIQFCLFTIFRDLQKHRLRYFQTGVTSMYFKLLYHAAVQNWYYQSINQVLFTNDWWWHTESVKAVELTVAMYCNSKHIVVAIRYCYKRHIVTIIHCYLKYIVTINSLLLEIYCYYSTLSKEIYCC